ncbi:2-keto-4-pentenoate hydratase/2-oxohepta-3-ene-1,7-dioic acid hydratase in catechol pathway [Thermocatellispora tengchongensis]|uniref:2-keto-4-pentenoate hydratase/2-oxohepta-3-ene-1,7-dioic acid hydratase in catechol pathway n=1 Tax=Thermocatellispora tengchongensis TaxID=1073253 RepID=A0A840PE16_9ACTN|nr:fumarylacetoacetate hydrolase family protein [Thermocatellispora tengchongensis]MBB5137858.1 2-keto-4-pentenoate hydratase/2-oxohepta-3-ene-1,7-dioic acid hydratase in catechol pathway [Thermocatellispora tengchongensis]
MRIANDAGRLVLVRDGGGLDVEKASLGLFGPDPQDVYDRWAEFRAWAATAEGEVRPLAPETLQAPAPRPRQVFAIGLNYRAHAEESAIEEPGFPTTFTKFPASLTGAYAPIELPSDTVDWEVELVVVIGKRAHRVKEADAWEHVAGLTVGQDLSERTVQLRPPVPQFSLGKSFPGFSPTGPELVTPDELPDPGDLEISCSIDGEVMQHARTSHMIFPIPVLIEKISAICPLLPGDLIFTGTPSGVGAVREPKRFLRPGEVLESRIAGIGTMRNRMTAGPAR